MKLRCQLGSLWHEESLAILRASVKGPGMLRAETLSNLGEVYRESRRFQEAVSAHQDAAAIFRETGRPA